MKIKKIAVISSSPMMMMLSLELSKKSKVTIFESSKKLGGVRVVLERPTKSFITLYLQYKYHRSASDFFSPKNVSKSNDLMKSYRSRNQR